MAVQPGAASPGSYVSLKDDASYELTRACGKLCRIPCLESTFAEPKCLYCGLQSTTNSCRQSTTNGDDLRQDRGRLTRGDDASLAIYLIRCFFQRIPISYQYNQISFSSCRPRRKSHIIQLTLANNRRLWRAERALW